MAWYVVDGLDGSGKSTVASMLAGELRSRGRSVLVRTHPGDRTAWGRLSSRYLLKSGRAAMLAASVFYFLDVLCSLWALHRKDSQYDDVVYVRYLLETAYFPDSVYRGCYRLCTGVLPEPDVRILVDVDPATAMERISARGGDAEVYETPEHLERARRHMLDLAEGWHVIDNRGSEDDLRRQLEAVAAGCSPPSDL